MIEERSDRQLKIRESYFDQHELDELMEANVTSDTKTRNGMEGVAAELLPAGKAFTTTRIVYYQPRLRFCSTEETSSLRRRQLSTPRTTAVSRR